MGGETSDGLHLLGLVHGECIDVERAVVAFAEEVHGLTVGRQHRVAVLPCPTGQVGMPAGLRVVLPDVTGHGRGVVLAPLVFHPFLVLVQEEAAGGCIADHLRRCAQHLLDASSPGRHPVEFRQAGGREERALGRVLQIGREEHVLSVRCEGRGSLVAGHRGQPDGCPPVSRHHEKVHASETVAGERDALPVGRPYGRGLVGILRGQPDSFPTFCIYLIDISLVTEGNLASVGRDLHVTHPQRGDGRMNAGPGNHAHDPADKCLFHLFPNSEVCRQRYGKPDIRQKKSVKNLEAIRKKAYLCTAFRGKHNWVLDYGVMVAQQVLVLFVQVRILVVQRSKEF